MGRKNARAIYTWKCPVSLWIRKPRYLLRPMVVKERERFCNRMGIFAVLAVGSRNSGSKPGRSLGYSPGWKGGISLGSDQDYVIFLQWYSEIWVLTVALIQAESFGSRNWKKRICYFFFLLTYHTQFLKMNGNDDFYWMSKLFPVNHGPPVIIYAEGSYPHVPTRTTRGVFSKQRGRTLSPDQYIRGQLYPSIHDYVFMLDA